MNETPPEHFRVDTPDHREACAHCALDYADDEVASEVVARRYPHGDSMHLECWAAHSGRVSHG